MARQELQAMNFRALATDYDGTIATLGTVDARTLQALDRFRASGRRLLMVTGREMNDLCETFQHLDRFEIIVAENGAVLYWPATCQEVLLTEPPCPDFVKLLIAREVKPLSVGRAIMATREPHETTVLELIKAMGLELHVIFNKGDVMVLPSGVNKATGLKQALKHLGLAPEEVVGVGDAENDHAFLEFCGFAVAVGNALPAVKERAKLVMKNNSGAGVQELIDLWLEEGLEGRVSHQDAA
jgi:hydroxymethylpyrimidine pyrophosphatase-like HAD family hydrolase